MGNQPPVSFTASVELTSVGQFSVGNLIHVSAFISDVNITNFLKHFQAVGFLYAGYPADTRYPTSEAIPLLPRLMNTSNVGVYSAQGDFAFLDKPPIATGLLLIPYNATGASENIPSLYTPSMISQVMKYQLSLVIGLQSETNTLNFNESAIKIAFVLGSFSVFFLQPILDSVLIKQKKRKKSTKAKTEPEGEKNPEGERPPQQGEPSSKSDEPKEGK